jgi:hypothetical protein
MNDSYTCSECERLRAQVRRLEETYTAARTLSSSTETTRPEYLSLKLAAEDAQLDLEIAFLAFEKHKGDHDRGTLRG